MEPKHQYNFTKSLFWWSKGWSTMVNGMLIYLIKIIRMCWLHREKSIVKLLEIKTSMKETLHKRSQLLKNRVNTLKNQNKLLLNFMMWWILFLRRWVKHWMTMNYRTSSLNGWENLFNTQKIVKRTNFGTNCFLNVTWKSLKAFLKILLP